MSLRNNERVEREETEEGGVGAESLSLRLSLLKGRGMIRLREMRVVLYLSLAA